MLSSAAMLYRAVTLLHAVFQAGCHVSLEQSRNVVTWLESFVQAFLLDIAADLIIAAAYEAEAIRSIGFSQHPAEHCKR